MGWVGIDAAPETQREPESVSQRIDSAPRIS